MSPDEIEAIAGRAAREAAQAVAEAQTEKLKEIVAESVRATLIQLGIEHANPIEMQKDFQHLRSWRQAGEDLRTKGIAALLGIFIAGAISLILVGMKEWFKAGGS